MASEERTAGATFSPVRGREIAALDERAARHAPAPPLARVAAALEEERPRWFYWVPVALGAGIAVYFALPVEPPLAVALLAPVIALSLRSAFGRATLVTLATGVVTLAALGFAIVALRTAVIGAPVLEAPVRAEVQGYVERVEPRPGGGERITLRVTEIAGLAPEKRPRRVRIALRERVAGLEPGAALSAVATLMPPAPPALPGGYDFGRHAYFLGLGGVGYATAPPRIVADLEAPRPGALAWWAGVERTRQAITRRIEAVLPGETGAIAAALVAGERGGISDETNAAYRDSGLFHILSISGLHMAIMGGAVFWFVRLLLALWPAAALLHPIKKWAAVAAAAACLCYLAISGGSFATVRSFVMIAIMFLAIVLDRPAIAMRNVALSALVILLAFPESLLDAGFQMSFAAVVALVAAYEAVRDRLAGGERGGPGVALRIGLFFGGIVLTTLVASLAVAPFAAYHFHKSQQYAVIANLIAVPITNFVVMPAALATLVVMPLGLEAGPLWIMGRGIEAMTAVAYRVGDLPGAVLHLPAMADGAFAAMVIGGLWLALWHARWRLAGLAAIGAGLVLAPTAPRPDVLVGRDGALVAVRDADGRLAFLAGGRAGFDVERWLEHDGDERAGRGDPGGEVAAGPASLARAPAPAAMPRLAVTAGAASAGAASAGAGSARAGAGSARAGAGRARAAPLEENAAGGLVLAVDGTDAAGGVAADRSAAAGKFGASGGGVVAADPSAGQGSTGAANANGAQAASGAADPSAAEGSVVARDTIGASGGVVAADPHVADGSTAATNANSAQAASDAADPSAAVAESFAADGSTGADGETASDAADPFAAVAESFAADGSTGAANANGAQAASGAADPSAAEGSVVARDTIDASGGVVAADPHVADGSTGADGEAASGAADPSAAEGSVVARDTIDASDGVVATDPHGADGSTGSTAATAAANADGEAASAAADPSAAAGKFGASGGGVVAAEPFAADGSTAAASANGAQAASGAADPSAAVAESFAADGSTGADGETGSGAADPSAAAGKFGASGGGVVVADPSADQGSFLVRNAIDASDAADRSAAASGVAASRAASAREVSGAGAAPNEAPRSSAGAATAKSNVRALTPGDAPGRASKAAPADTDPTRHGSGTAGTAPIDAVGVMRAAGAARAPDAAAATPETDARRHHTRRDVRRADAKSGAARRGISCDPAGCVARIKGVTIAVPRHPAAVAEDCRAAALVVLAWPRNVACAGPARVLDSRLVGRHGTHAVYVEEGGRLRVETVAAWRGARPWSGAVATAHERRAVRLTPPRERDAAGPLADPSR